MSSGRLSARKVAAMGEIFGVKTAWHGPGDVSPIGHAANVTLDLVCYNFGIQEYSPFNDAMREVFDGCPVMKDGYLYANEKPGWGIEVGEKAAAKYPYGMGERGERKDLNGGWGKSAVATGPSSSNEVRNYRRRRRNYVSARNSFFIVMPRPGPCGRLK